jgi:hypothetical protein
VVELRREGFAPSTTRAWLPLVFLNACGTAQGQDFGPNEGVPLGWMKAEAAEKLETCFKTQKRHFEV